MAALTPDATRVIPVGHPWQKARGPVASATHRVAMLRLALQVYPTARVDARELTRAGATYTVDTLTELNAEHPHDTFTWLIGSDAFAKLDTWHRATDLARLTSFAVVCRAGASITLPALATTYTRLDFAPPPISSTDVRATLAAGRAIRGLVPEHVCDYIEHHHLYR